MSLGKFALLVPLTLLSVSVALQGQAIAGRVTDDRSQAPLERASVVLLDSAGAQVADAYTDAMGRFVLHAPAPGRYALLVRRPGYAPRRTASLVSVGLGATVRLDFALAALPEIQSLATVRIDAERRSLRKRKVLGIDLRSTPGELVTRSEVDAAVGAISVLDVLRRKRLIGFRADGDMCLKPVAGGARRGATSLRAVDDAQLEDAGTQRSTRSCLPLYVDEVLLAQPGDPGDVYESAISSIRPDDVDWIFVPRGGAIPAGVHIYTRTYRVLSPRR